MEVGCNTYSLRSRPRAEAFATMRELGFRHVELWAGHVRGDDATTVLSEASVHGLALRAYCAGGLFDLPLPEVERRLDAALSFAAGLGIDLVTGIVDRSGLPVVDRLCARWGMRFAIENHWYAEFARPADYAALERCSDAVGVNIDTGHFAYLGCDLERAATRLGSRTWNVHLKVVRTAGRLERWLRARRREYAMEAVLPGPNDGLEPFVTALGRSGYAGMLAVEHEASQLDLRALESFRARGQELIAQAGGRP